MQIDAIPLDYSGLVDLRNGTVDRRVFSDPDIYQRELEHIFARGWNFMCHESQIATTGDYFLNYIGEDSVIAVRDRNGDIQVFLNTCRHRGNALCRAESGNAKSFLCTYHGWTYDLQGQLVGVPGLKDFYHQDLQREKWGLIRAAKVEMYKGFVFATMDPAAPTLDEFLGKVGKVGLSMVAERGDVVVLDGIPKNTIECNWKFAVDNVFDWYHAPVSHASAGVAGYYKPGHDPRDHIVALGEYGHAISGPRLTSRVREAAQSGKSASHTFDERWRDRPEAMAELGSVGLQVHGHANIFPNLWVASRGLQLCLRLPKGPSRTELWWFTVLDKNMGAQERKAALMRTNHTHGPAGMLEQDDGDNWDQSSQAARGVLSRRHALNYGMGLGRGEIKRDETGLAYIDTRINEHAQLWNLRAWADWMTAGDWPELRRNHSVPSGVI